MKEIFTDLLLLVVVALATGAVAVAVFCTVIAAAHMLYGMYSEWRERSRTKATKPMKPVEPTETAKSPNSAESTPEREHSAGYGGECMPWGYNPFGCGDIWNPMDCSWLEMYGWGIGSPRWLTEMAYLMERGMNKTETEGTGHEDDEEVKGKVDESDEAADKIDKEGK